MNANVFKQTLYVMREWQGKGAQVSLCLIGSKGLDVLPPPGSADPRQRLGPRRPAARQGSHRHREGDAGRLSRRASSTALFLVNAQFVNTMTQKPCVEQLLPVQALDTEGLQEHWDYIYEPDAAGILDGLLMRYIESQVYRGAVENVASEMAARMVAMGAASDNAGKLIGELQLIYNKARQAAITKELSEIVGGAAAV